MKLIAIDLIFKTIVPHTRTWSGISPTLPKTLHGAPSLLIEETLSDHSSSSVAHVEDMMAPSAMSGDDEYVSTLIEKVV